MINSYKRHNFIIISLYYLYIIKLSKIIKFFNIDNFY